MGDRDDLDASLERALLFPNTVDTHFHSIEMRRADLDPRAILDWCFLHGMTAALDISVAVEDVPERLSLAAHHPGLLVAAGYYPSEAKRFATSPSESKLMMERLESALSNNRVAAVGEIGLDWHHDYASKREQEALLVAQIEIANAHARPVVIHNREADREILDLLGRTRPEHGGIMHCFSSDLPTALKLIDLGFAISFAGNVTFRNSHDIQETARRVPASTLLVETDAPYLAPMPLRGRKNHPGYIGHTYRFLAGLRGEAVEDLAARVQENFTRITRSASGP